MRHLSQPTLRLADHHFAERIPQRRIRKATIYPPISKVKRRYHANTSEQDKETVCLRYPFLSLSATIH